MHSTTSSSILICIIIISCCVATLAHCNTKSNINHYTINGSQLGPQFDGIGAISGGGATSVLLWTYPEPARSRILDYLFKPNFGASLHMLKVEIGGSGDSTDGAELSTEESPGVIFSDPGYEIWLMKEAKKRNKHIKLYGLPWTFPKWVSCAEFPNNCDAKSNDPYRYIDKTVGYVMDYVDVLGQHNLTLDYLGVWNERPWNNSYIIALRKALDRNPYSRATKIVAPDGFDSFTKFAQEMIQDPALAEAVYAIGAHYPGTESTPDARATKKALWASEDCSTFNSARAGAGCLARIFSQNFVHGQMTGTVVWNAIASYQKGTKWYRAGLMTALKPWGGGTYGSLRGDDWSVGPMIWATAHTTQFAQPGWRYLANAVFAPAGSPTGSGKLQKGGSYVTLVSSSSSSSSTSADFSIIIEKMSRDMSPCVRPVLLNYDVAPETARFFISRDLVEMNNLTHLHLWHTHFATPLIEQDKTVEFEQLAPLPLQQTDKGGYYFDLHINIDSLYTITSLSGAGNKGSFGETAATQQPEIFPRNYVENFDSLPLESNARWWSDMNGGFMVVRDPALPTNKVLRQVVPLRPITWGHDTLPHSFLGHEDMVAVSFSIDARLNDVASGVVVGLRGRKEDSSVGVFLAVDGLSPSKWGLWTSLAFMPAVGLSGAVKTGSSSDIISTSLRPGAWARFEVTITADNLYSCSINGQQLVKDLDVNKELGLLSVVPAAGFAVVGTKQYGNGTAFTDFDNARLEGVEFASCVVRPRSVSAVAAGSKICNVECASEVGNRVPTSLWSFDVVPNNREPSKSSGVIESKAAPGLCITAMSSSSSTATATEPMWLELQACNRSDPVQLWSWVFDGIAPDSERQSFIYLQQRRCIDIYQQRADLLCAQLDAWPCNTGQNQAFFFDQDSGEIGNEATATCVGVC